MDVLSPISSLIPNKNSLRPSSVRPQRASIPKESISNNTFKYASANEIDAVISISEETKKAVGKNGYHSSGSIEINNHRVSYSLTENKDLVIKIIDRASNEVVRQIPREEMIKVKEALSKVLEQKLNI